MRRIAQDGVAVRVDSVGLGRAAAAHELVTALMKRQPVYGRTTGVGANRMVPVNSDGTELDAEPFESHSLRLLRSHAGGAGPLLEPGAVP